MRTEMALYAVPLFLAAGILFGFALYALRRRTVAGALSMSLLGFCSAWWAFADGMLVLSTTWDSYQFWWKAGYAGILSLPLAMVVFALDYSGHREHLTGTTLVPLGLPLLAALALVLTEPRHGLMWTVTGTDWSQPYVPIVERGIAFWFQMLYVYGLMALAGVILSRLFKRSHRVYRRQTYVMLTAILLPLLPNLVHVLGLNPIQNFDLTPLTLAIAAPALAASVFKFRLRDFVPVARRAVFDELDDGVLILSLDGRVVDINPAAMAAVGGQIDPDAAQQLEELSPQLAQVIDQGESTRIGFSTGLPERHFDVTVSPVDDHRGNAAGKVVVLRDVTERRILERQLAFNAERDALTGLLNRSRFDARLGELWIDRPSSIALMLIDLDNFKPVNDQHGHHTGDEVLKIIGGRIAEALPESAEIARWGGDEFAVAMTGASPRAAREIAHDLRGVIERPIAIAGDATVSVSASIGLAFGRNVGNAASLLQEADTRMYDDKARRRISATGLGEGLFNMLPARVLKP